MRKGLLPVLALVLAFGLALSVGVTTAGADGPKLYGIESETGWIYEIDVGTATETQVFEVQDPPVSVNGSRPNGLAFDSVNNRLYYATYQAPNELYFCDVDTLTQVKSGDLDHEIAAADFYDGKYYYIAGGPAGRTDDLYEVAFNPDGTMASVTQHLSISSDAHAWWFYGDLAVSPGGTIYADGLCETDDEVEFFEVSTTGTGFSMITVLGGTTKTLQLGFGYDGTLYGHSINTMNLYSVDTTSGDLTLVFTGTKKYTDLSSGPREPAATPTPAPTPTPTPTPTSTPTPTPTVTATPPPAVGGTILPTDTLGLMMPWLVVGGSLVLVAIVLLAVYGPKYGARRASHK